MQNPPGLSWYERMGVAPPTSESHGTAEDIRANLKRARTTNWRLEGNTLYADTDMGPLVQTIPTSVILVGEDSRGLPIFRSIKL